MTIDNFARIDYLISRMNKLSSADDFLFVQLYKRRKDHPHMSVDMELIDNFFITKEKCLSHYKERIVSRCLQTGSRAYIRLNKRSFSDVALVTTKKIIDLIRSNQAHAAKTAYISACGSEHADNDKTWLIDADNLSEDQLGEVCALASELQSKRGVDPLLEYIPTVNGGHIITRPFHVDEFKSLLNIKIDIHKDNPTLLFYYKTDEN